MKIGQFKKQPAEKLRYTIDYSAWLSTAETITGFSYVISPSGALAIDDPNTIETSNTVSFIVTGGTDNTDYKVTVQITTSNAQLKEDEIYYEVRDT